MWLELILPIRGRTSDGSVGENGGIVSLSWFPQGDAYLLMRQYVAGGGLRHVCAPAEYPTLSCLPLFLAASKIACFEVILGHTSKNNISTYFLLN